jgi:hypothetical protein
MRRLAIQFLVILFFASCSTMNEFYQGFVIDENNNPIVEVLVSEYQREENQARTDKIGYFKLSKKSCCISDLVFAKAGFRTDTIRTVWHQAGETTKYNFIMKKDTTRVKLEIRRL